MSTTYLAAIREAQAVALREDPNVFIYGQDIGKFGGAFKATKGLIDEFPIVSWMLLLVKMLWWGWQLAQPSRA